MRTAPKTGSLWLRRLVWGLGALLLLWLAAWLLVPPLLKQQIEKSASEQLGRKVTVGQIDFKPWTLELTLQDLAIATQDGTATQFQFKRLYANAEMESLLRLAPVVQTLTLEAPQVRLTHLGAGRYDVDDLIARFSKPAAKPDSEPPRFALFNLTVVGGSFDFDDRPVAKKHLLRELNLGIPFLSNLPSDRDIKVELRLAFKLNGSQFDSAGQTAPFAPSRKTDASLQLRQLDLVPFLPYLPAGLPVQLQRGVLGADLKLAFEQSPTPTVRLTGGLQLAGIKVADSRGGPLLTLDGMTLALDDVRPLQRIVKLASLHLVAPHLLVTRDAAGALNLLPGVAAQTDAPVAAAPAAPTVAGEGWNLALAKLSLQGGSVEWADATVKPAAAALLHEWDLEASDLAWPIERAVPFQGALALRQPGSGNSGPSGKSAAAPAGDDAKLVFSGTATDKLASLKLALANLSLSTGAPYLTQFLEPTLRGNLSTEIELAWTAPDLLVKVSSLVLGDLALAAAGGSGKTELASVRKISVAQLQLDPAKRSLSVGKLTIDQPRFALLRTADKQWMFERWLKPASVSPPSSVGPGSPGAQGKDKLAPVDKTAPWVATLAELALEGGVLQFEDQAQSKPVVFELAALKLAVKNATADGTRPTPVQFSARLNSARNQPGQLEYRGTVQLQPLVAQGAVLATLLPVHLFEPYFAAGLNIELLRADASFKGDVRYADAPGGASIKLSGDSALEDFRANTLAAGQGGLQLAEELLTWKALSLRGIDVALSPGVATAVSVKETTLSDFFARLIIYADGRINLQDLVKGAAGPTAPLPVAGASAPASVPAVAASAAPPAVAATATGTGLEPIINIGPVSLINGKVLFSDRFVKPNYSANLSELTGKLSAFSSQAQQGQVQLADVELRGRAEGTASLEILGRLNPLAKPLALDIKGLVRDLELAPLSPYSIKYAGHGIERGKLSVDVAYLVKPDGQLTASNKLVLNQLSFGDKVEGAPNSLPVRLAVALLADRNGIIDINLPISGSLNDPQFSLGPIIFKVIVNLIVKAITAPFSLLASAFGGAGDELGQVAFAPGSAALLPEARAGLDKVARALVERPALKLTVVGTASIEAEREAFKRERLLVLLLAEKRRGLVISASATGAADAAAVNSVSDTERAALLKEVYKRADIVKPRNLAGVVQDIEVAEIEALLLANIAVTDDAIQELALQRGIAVKDYLSSQKLPVERLFLGAAKPVAADPKWSPRAELNLASN